MMLQVFYSYKHSCLKIFKCMHRTGMIDQRKEFSMSEIQKQLNDGFKHACIDQSIAISEQYRPTFITNNEKKGSKVLSCIEEELNHCEEFYISVAFITMGGLTTLLETFKTLEEKGIQGKILTTNYLNFTDPSALKKLNALSNIEVKMYVSKEVGFHTKGYIFKNDGLYKILVGSSNLTMNALTKNKEWNTKLLSYTDGEFANSVLDEFDALWDDPHSYAFDEFYETYKENYQKTKEKRQQVEMDDFEKLLNERMMHYDIQPNSMQKEFIDNLDAICDQGENRALLVSATGTGKTYAAALALRNREYKKVLFLAHREQILKQAKTSFEKVFYGRGVTFGMLSGNYKEVDADYVFATMQTMCKEEIMSLYQKDTFDAIVIDEVHRAASNSYQKIMDYFEPELYLGMSASPDRPDGFDIYEIFDHNIAQEVRLQQALQDDLLCPFHYFGVSDLEVDGNSVDSKDFCYLTCDERIKHIIRNAKYYGHCGDRVKGLIFTSSLSEGKEISKKLNAYGYRTVFLSGSDSIEKRLEMVERLEKDYGDDVLDYIITVDIFNEGVDIPQVNQVIMLRPTQSPIIFIQQLGRGLRKASNKEFVVIIDFIANYQNNYMIPIALSGDQSYNKDSMRHYVLEGNRIIPGSSTIHFDQVARSKIFESIDRANVNSVRLIKENYKILKNKLGRIPYLHEFDAYGMMDVLCMFHNQNIGSYYKFLVKYEKDFQGTLTSTMEKMLEYVSKKFASGKRVDELVVLESIMHNKIDVIAHSKKKLEVYGKVLSTFEIETIVNEFMANFLTGTGAKTYEECVFIEPSGSDYKISKQFEECLHNKQFKEHMEELVLFGIYRYQVQYRNTYKDTDFVLGKKYTYEDVCRLLNWDQQVVAQNIGGYKYDERTNTMPVFINYDKHEDIQDTINYNDRLINETRLVSISKSNRKIESSDVQRFLHAKEQGIQIDLFVRKNKDDKISKEFYYLGQMQASGNVEQFIMKNTTNNAVEIEWILDTPIRKDLYDYIVNN